VQADSVNGATTLSGVPGAEDVSIQKAHVGAIDDTPRLVMVCVRKAKNTHVFKLWISFIHRSTSEVRVGLEGVATHRSRPRPARAARWKILLRNTAVGSGDPLLS
jgi:hypothetical protein